MAENQYKVLKEILSFPSDSKNGTFHTEVNLISWHGHEPKIDIRRWADGREKSSKGICISEKEFKQIIEHFGGTYDEIDM